MPRAARFRIAAIGELFRQLRYAPAETRAREMNAAERLVHDVDPDGVYPHDFVVYRVTGYRPDPTDAPTSFVGAALREDLVNLVQRLSDGLELPPDRDGRPALPIEAVATRLRVSTKTVQRYRREGLVCHYVRFPDGATRLACYEDAVDRFANDHRARIDRAAAFTRLGASLEAQIVDEARRLHETEGVSLNEAALRLSRAHGRAHETVRTKLRRHDRRARARGEAIFVDPGPLTERDLRVIHRAWGRGVGVRALATHFGKSPATIRRARNRRRAERLRALDLRAVHLPTFDRDDAEAVILSAPVVTDALGDLLPGDDALAVLAAARAAPPVDESEADALIAAYNLLKRRAGAALDALPPWPGSRALERIEADLRWAGALKRRLVSLALPAAIVRVEQNLHRALTTQPASHVVTWLGLARDVVSGVVDTVDPGRGQRLDRLATHAMDRALAARVPPAGTRAPSRATARHESGAIPMDGLLTGLVPWEALLELRRDLRPAEDAPAAPARDVLRLFYGLGGAPPLDPVAIAARLDLTPIAVRRLLRAAETALREKR